MQTFAPHTRLLALGANFVLYGVVSFRCASSSLVRSVNRRSSSFPFSLRSFLSPLIRRTSNRCRFSVLSLWGRPLYPHDATELRFSKPNGKKKNRTFVLSKELYIFAERTYKSTVLSSLRTLYDYRLKFVSSPRAGANPCDPS